jgi:hypothetical protein
MKNKRGIKIRRLKRPAKEIKKNPKEGKIKKSAREFPSPLGDRDDSAVISLGIPRCISE